jgi:hypothetical protein
VKIPSLYVVCPSSIRITDNPFGIFTLLVVMLSVLLRLGLQRVKIPKGIICSPNRRRTDNITTKCVKIPKGLSVVTDNPFGIFTLLVVMLSVRLRYGLQIIPFGIFTLLVVMFSVLLRLGLQITPTTTSVKIPKGLSVVRIEDGQTT